MRTANEANQPEVEQILERDRDGVPPGQWAAAEQGRCGDLDRHLQRDERRREQREVGDDERQRPGHRIEEEFEWIGPGHHAASQARVPQVAEGELPPRPGRLHRADRYGGESQPPVAGQDQLREHVVVGPVVAHAREVADVGQRRPSHPLPLGVHGVLAGEHRGGDREESGELRVVQVLEGGRQRLLAHADDGLVHHADLRIGEAGEHAAHLVGRDADVAVGKKDDLVPHVGHERFEHAHLGAGRRLVRAHDDEHVAVWVAAGEPTDDVERRVGRVGRAKDELQRLVLEAEE